MDLPAQISLILACCSSPMLLPEIVSDAKDPLSWVSRVSRVSKNEHVKKTQK